MKWFVRVHCCRLEIPQTFDSDLETERVQGSMPLLIAKWLKWCCFWIENQNWCWNGKYSQSVIYLLNIRSCIIAIDENIKVQKIKSIRKKGCRKENVFVCVFVLKRTKKYLRVVADLTCLPWPCFWIALSKGKVLLVVPKCIHCTNSHLAVNCFRSWQWTKY